MDCLSFRRKLLEAPLRNDAEVTEHEAACPTCAEFARRTRAQEARLRALLNVSPPPELPERIQLAVSFAQRPLPAGGQRRWASLAAGLLLVVSAISLSWYLSPLERRSLGLAEAVLQHVHDELHHLREINDISTGQLTALFGRHGAQMHDHLGQVNFAAECLMRRKKGIHLVLPGRLGPVTVFFMPDEAVSQVARVEDQRFQGEVLPTDWGSLAIVGEHGEPLDAIARRLLDAVAWPVRLSATAGYAGLKPPRA